MVVDNALHMISGKGENSSHYSTLQEKVIARIKPMLEDTIKTHYSNAFQRCFTIADLGCVTGPNTLLVTSHILDAVIKHCQETGQQLPDEFQVLINDLPGNDFNTIFKLLPAFYEKLKKERELASCYILGVPGSFYTRLFPSKTLHFVHSSSSLHWLSRVPEGIENNNENICMENACPRNVFEAYLDQFQIDFSRFLCCRGEEMVDGGQMVLTIMGRSNADHTSKDCRYPWEIIPKALLHMAAEGLVQKADIYSFNLPLYMPYSEEVRAIVEKEGSFHLDKIETLEVNWDPTDNDYEALVVASDMKKTRGENVARVVRAVFEPMLASQFGEAVMDDFFDRYAYYLAEHLSVEKTKIISLVISLTKFQ